MFPIGKLSEKAQISGTLQKKELSPKHKGRSTEPFYLKSMEIIKQMRDSPLERNKTDDEMSK